MALRALLHFERLARQGGARLSERQLEWPRRARVGAAQPVEHPGADVEVADLFLNDVGGQREDRRRGAECLTDRTQANNPSFRGLSHEQQETPNKSLDASGGSVFRNLIRPAMLD